MVDFDSIGRRLREGREALGLSQTDMAEAVLAGGARGATRQTQSNYEKGERMPDAGYLAVAAELGIDVLYVLTGRREKKPKLPVGASVQISERLPTWASAAGRMGLLEEIHDPVRPDTMHPSAPLMGGFTVTQTGGLLVLAASSDGPPLRLPVAFNGGLATREYQVIPRYRAAASAGKTDGRQVEAAELVADAAGVLAMDRAFMRDQLGSDRSGFVTVTVKGDSMERTLMDGETIIIDSTINDVDGSGIYVVQVGKNLLVKRLLLRMDGGVLVKSDNAAYADGDQEFTAEQVQGIRVVGRMVWPKFR